jgi:hypothetical protein
MFCLSQKMSLIGYIAKVEDRIEKHPQIASYREEMETLLSPSSSKTIQSMR